MRLIFLACFSMSFFSLSFAACRPVTAQDQTAQDQIAQNQTAQDQTAQDQTREAVAPVSQSRVAVMPETAKPLVAAARDRLDARVIYDGRYMRLDYPGGDVPANIGVCTDVVIRSLRAAYDFDLQKAVHEDMKMNFSQYPTDWGLTRTDKNIDHRRVPNLEAYFTRAGQDLPITRRPSDYKPGDIVSWRLDSNTGSDGLPHIGIVSNRLSRRGTPLIIHNIGGGVEESDMLFNHRITGHYRFTP
jgi:uncharacterized protein YijF (DUF1287 family)